LKIYFRSNRWLAGIIAASVIFRVVAAGLLGDQVVNLPGTFDQISYNNLALRVLNGHGFSFGETWWPITPAGAPTAHWSFLYTLYLVAVYSIFGLHPLIARLIQAVLTGLLQPYLAYLIGARLFNKTVGLVSAGLSSVYAYFIYYGAALMTEPFFITAVMAGLYLTMLLAAPVIQPEIKTFTLNRLRLYIFAGLLMGAAVLLRQLWLLLIPFLFFWILWAHRKQGLRSTLIGLSTSSLIIIFMIAPFTIYNFSRFGRFVLLNTNSGFAFFWANHPIYGTHFQSILPPDSGDYQSLIPPELRNLDEAALDQALLKRGIQFVIDDPGRYILLSISKIPAYFMFWPSKDSGLVSNLARVGSFGMLWPFMLYGLLYSRENHNHSRLKGLSSSSLLLIGVVSIYTMIHLLSWALIRYRLPVDAILIVFAGWAFVDLAQRLAAWRKWIVRIA
jgi:4-amino-4-deoxy-L-arabinose transferase-like glycosyltransferase